MLTEEEIVSLYVPYMIDATSDLGSLRHTTDTANLLFDGNQVIIHALGEETVRSLNRTAAPAMSRMLAHDFGMQRVFVFRNKDEKYEEKIREMRSQTEKELKRVNAETDRAAAMAAGEHIGRCERRNGIGRGSRKRGSLFSGRIPPADAALYRGREKQRAGGDTKDPSEEISS